MTTLIENDHPFFSRKPISNVLEIGAYETLWLDPKTSFKSIAEIFANNPGSLPSDFVSEEDALKTASKVITTIENSGVSDFGIMINGAGDYPDSLKDAKEPVEALYYRGWWDLVNSPKRIAVVGTREVSDEGIRRVKKLVKLLVKHNFTIVSGLAKGVDTYAHKTAIEEGGMTITVPGTPLSECYPKENLSLQEEIAEKFLLISQVPVLRYGQQDYRKNRLFFPERNKTMSALTDATVIVEAGETSGTLIQAQAALHQGRKLFILDSCFKNPNIRWPAQFEQRGAIRVRDFDDILNALSH